MFRRSSQSTALTTKRKMPNKLIAGFAALSTTAIIAASGFAAAATPMNKPSKHDCQQAGFTNYGQCVKEWAHHKNHPGTGYGGNTSVATNIDLTLNNSNHNIINVIVNIFR
ncbi:MAG TPA: hypothetical protein VLH86_03945 [Patescibacteria group bacterium]|nr:hypothetical protein [Patescibacteria group bacterium]